MSEAKDARPAYIIIGLAALQIIFQIVIGAVTGAQLDTNDLCQLNLDPSTGRVCDFVYCSIGFGLLFSIALLVTVYYGVHKNRPGPHTAGATVGLGAYSFFWYLVFSITIAIRGQQATDAGQPGTTPRQAVVGLSWIVTVFFLAIALLALWEQHVNKLPAVETELNRSFLSKVEKVSSSGSGATPKGLSEDNLVKTSGSKEEAGLTHRAQ